MNRYICRCSLVLLVNACIVNAGDDIDRFKDSVSLLFVQT